MLLFSKANEMSECLTTKGEAIRTDVTIDTLGTWDPSHSWTHMLLHLFCAWDSLTQDALLTPSGLCPTYAPQVLFMIQTSEHIPPPTNHPPCLVLPRVHIPIKTCCPSMSSPASLVLSGHSHAILSPTHLPPASASIHSKASALGPTNLWARFTVCRGVLCLALPLFLTGVDTTSA